MQPVCVSVERMTDVSGRDRLPGSGLVLFSGGQDSTTVLFWALERFARVETIGFDYGQRHGIELECRVRVRDSLATGGTERSVRCGPDHLIDLGSLGVIWSSALTMGGPIVRGRAGLPTSHVAGRNGIFMSVAAAVAVERGLDCLVVGMCQNDAAGYPDCRAETILAYQTALGLGLGREMNIIAPLLHLTKAQTWQMAHDLGGDWLIDLIVEHTHTCYLGERVERHAWGYGCSDCPACKERERGWWQWNGQI